MFLLQFQKLVSIPTKSRDFKEMFISLMVIMFMVGMVALTIKAVTPPPGPPRYLGNLKSNYEIHTKSGHLDTERFMNRLNLDPSHQTLSMPPGCQVPLKKILFIKSSQIHSVSWQVLNWLSLTKTVD